MSGHKTKKHGIQYICVVYFMMVLYWRLEMNWIDSYLPWYFYLLDPTWINYWHFFTMILIPSHVLDINQLIHHLVVKVFLMHNFHDYAEFETMTTTLREIQKKWVNSSHIDDFLLIPLWTVYERLLGSRSLKLLTREKILTTQEFIKQ